MSVIEFVNLTFEDPVRFKGIVKCIVCSEKRNEPFSNCDFWRLGTFCPNQQTAHSTARLDIESEPGVWPGVCEYCESYFLLEVLSGNRHCSVEGCRRILQLDLGVVKKHVVSKVICRCVHPLSPFHYTCSVGNLINLILACLGCCGPCGSTSRWLTVSSATTQFHSDSAA